MTTNIDKLRELAEAAYGAHVFPDDISINAQDGFEIDDEGTAVEFRRKLYFADLSEGGDGPSQTANFTVRFDPSTMEIEEAYCLLGSNGDILGEFTEDSLAEAYDTADIPLPSASRLAR
jgi:hypothetical protein